MNGVLWFRQTLRMVHLWTLSHRFSLNSDFISQHPHKLHSWAVIQMQGWSHSTCKYELKAAVPQDYREFSDTRPSVRQGHSHCTQKGLGSPSRPSLYYSLRHHLECDRHSHMHTGPSCFPASTSHVHLRLKMCWAPQKWNSKTSDSPGFLVRHLQKVCFSHFPGGQVRVKCLKLYRGTESKTGHGTDVIYSLTSSNSGCTFHTTCRSFQNTARECSGSTFRSPPYLARSTPGLMMSLLQKSMQGTEVLGGFGEHWQPWLWDDLMADH